jgi:adenine-specific DNA-methyltransferase
MGMNVLANDIEPFSFLVNYVYLHLTQEDLSHMFDFMGGIDAYYSFLNFHGMYAFTSGYAEGKQLLSKFYAPQVTKEIKEGAERVYFSHENALFIDAVRGEIEQSWIDGKLTGKEKAVVLASLLYQSSMKANISGTFTSYHKRLYREGKSIRGRITEPIELTIPTLLPSNESIGEVSQQDALEFVREHSGDIAFLDPPSSVQQYGSAYHLLNSITLWDDFAPSMKLGSNGFLGDKSGIRSDWKLTRSPFCSLKESYKAIYSLLQRIDCGQIIFSYPTNGILSNEQIYELLSFRNSEIRTIALPKKRGGGKSPIDGKVAVDQLFITGKVPSFSLLMPEGLQRIELVSKIESYRDSIFTPIEVVFDHFSFIQQVMIDHSPDYQQFMEYPLGQLEQILATFASQVVTDSLQSLRIVLTTYHTKFSQLEAKEKHKIEKRVLSILRFIRSYEEKNIKDSIELLEHSFKTYVPHWESRKSFFQECANCLDSFIARSHRNENQL